MPCLFILSKKNLPRNCKKTPAEPRPASVFLQLSARSEPLLITAMMRLSIDDLHCAHRLCEHLHLVLELHALSTVQDIALMCRHIARGQIVEGNHHHIRSAAITHTDVGVLRRKTLQHVIDGILHVVLKWQMIHRIIPPHRGISPDERYRWFPCSSSP